MDFYLLQIDFIWILYNKFKGNEFINEYVGFLMAFGLNEYFIYLYFLNVYDYFSKVRVFRKYKLINEINLNNLFIYIVNVQNIWVLMYSIFIILQGSEMIIVGLLFGLVVAK